MRAFRHIAVNAIVWATSASILMAATPVVVCRCPTGEWKPFCSPSNAVSSPSCKGKCCVPEPGKTSCCGQADVANGVQAPDAEPQAPTDGPAIVKAQCQKALVYGEQPARCQHDNKVSQVTFEILHFQSQTQCGIALAPCVPELAGWQLDQTPPPTDLVTSLQRRTI